MPTLAGWLTGEQVAHDIIDQTLTSMANVLGSHGGQLAHTIQPGAGLIAFSDSAFAMQRNDDPPVLDWVPARRTMVYRRPLSGAHVLYYIADWPAKGNLLFASEIKALLATGVPRRLHLAALDALLRYGFIPAPWTAFKDIYVLPAGSILRWQHAKTVVNASTDYHLDGAPSPTDTPDQLHTLLDEASAGLLPPHDQLFALSNADSSSTLAIALATRHTQTPFTVATLDYKKGTFSKRWREAEDIATAYQRPFLAITGVDQPDFWTATLAGLESPAVNTRPLALHQLLHTGATETGARVAISGLGAAALLGLQAHKQAGSKQRDVLQAYAQALSPRSTGTTPPLWSQEAATTLRKAEPWEDSLHARKLARQAAKFADKQLGHYYLDLHLRLPNLLVNEVQQLATQEHLAVRSPYLNTHVMDLLTRLPAVLKDGTPKSGLIAQLTQRYLPNQVEPLSASSLTAPAASLLDVAASPLLQQVLSREALQARGIFNPQAVEELLRQKEVSRELLLVFTTQLWCQLFEVGL